LRHGIKLLAAGFWHQKLAAGAPCTLDAKRRGRPLVNPDIAVASVKVPDFVEYVCKSFKCGILSIPARA
jgi:hypothetical protein